LQHVKLSIAVAVYGQLLMRQKF